MKLSTRLRTCAGQENCDSEEHDLMQEASEAIDKLEAENQELRAQLAIYSVDIPLDERMKAVGMSTVDEIIAKVAECEFMLQAEVVDLATFHQWIESKYREYLIMQARLQLNKQEDDELFEWALAHAATFGDVLGNFNKIIKPVAEVLRCAERVRESIANMDDEELGEELTSLCKAVSAAKGGE